MDPESFRKFATQVRSVGNGGPPRGFLTGSGLLIVLVAGGFALNASLFNGTSLNLAERERERLTLAEVDGGHRAIKYTR